MPEIGQKIKSRQNWVLSSSASPPDHETLCEWLVGSYIIALLIPNVIYTVVALWNGIFDPGVLFYITIGFPAAFLMHLRPFNIAALAIGYAVYILIGSLCIALRNIGNLWKIFLWIFLILLLINLISCVPLAISVADPKNW